MHRESKNRKSRNNLAEKSPQTIRELEINPAIGDTHQTTEKNIKEKRFKRKGCGLLPRARENSYLERQSALLKDNHASSGGTVHPYITQEASSSPNIVKPPISGSRLAETAAPSYIVGPLMLGGTSWGFHPG